MKCEPCTYSPESVEDSSQTLSSDTRQSSLWSGMPTPAKSSENAQQTDGSPTCQCGKGTLDCSIHPSTPAEWVASMRDSLVRTLALPGIKRALDMRHDPAFIEKSSVLLASFDPVTCSLKTSQQSLVTDSEPYSQTLPRWGSLRNGVVSEHPIAAHRITGTGGFAWPTPSCQMGSMHLESNALERNSMSLASAVHYYPTPLARDWKGKGYGNSLLNVVRKMYPTPSAEDNRNRGHLGMPSIQRRQAKGKQLMLSMVVSTESGQLNPDWVEWLMGFPIEFTASKGWGTPKRQSRQRLPGSYLEANK